MKRRISNLGTYEFIILQTLKSVLGIFIAIGVLFIAWTTKLTILVIILTVIDCLLLTVICRAIITIFKIVDVYQTDKGILIERFNKKEEMTYDSIKSVKYFKIYPFQAWFREPDIKIAFYKETKFGYYIFLRPTQLDQNNVLHFDTNIKSLIDSKLNNDLNIN